MWVFRIWRAVSALQKWNTGAQRAVIALWKWTIHVETAVIAAES